MEEKQKKRQPTQEELIQIRSGHIKNLETLKAIEFKGLHLPMVNWQKADLRKVDLQEVDLQGSNLAGANLTEVNLQGAKLNDVNLQEADLKRARLNHVDVARANLEKAKLQGAELQGAILREAKLAGAGLKNANLYLAQLQLAMLRQANLENAILEKSNLQGTNLMGANLTNASLVDANLRATNLRGANMKGADLQGCQLTFLAFSGPEYAAGLYRTKFSKDVIDSNFYQTENKEYVKEQNTTIERLKNNIFKSYSAKRGATPKAVFALAMMRLEEENSNFSPLDWGREHQNFETIFNEKQQALQDESVSNAIQAMQDKIKIITGKGEGSYEAQRVSGSDRQENVFKTFFKNDSRNAHVEWLRQFNNFDLKENTQALHQLFAGLLDIKSSIEAEDNLFPSKLLEQINDVLSECSNVAKKLGEQPLL